MRSNYDVLVYAADAEDFETEGLCGPLAPISCVSVEEAGGDSSLEMAHEYDEQGRWKHLAVGNILRAWVQMRTPPTIDASGGHITSVEVWTVKATATKAQRYLYSKRTGGKKLKLLPAGATVEVTQKTSGRYRVTTQWGQGYVNPDALSYEIDYTIPDDGDDAVIAPVQIRPQLFEIYSIERGLESLTVYARHISYQLMKNLTTYSADTPVSLGACAQGILDGCMQAHAFQAHSDILDTRTGVAWKRVNPLEAILDPETGVMALWRCELLRDNWDIYLLESVGADRGVTIEAGKNLAGITVTEDVTNVATQLIPVAQDKDGSELLLPEGSIVSERADDYPQRYIYTFQCPDKVDSSHSKASVLNSMRAQCQQMLDGGCDLPTLSVSVEVAQIEEAEAAGAPVDAERRVVELLEPLPVYDWVSVYDGRRGMAFRAQIVRREWDCIHGRLNAIEAGTLAATMGSVSIATWQVPDGVSGMKLAAGTVGAAALRADSVTAAAINAESLTADSAVVVKLSAAALDAVTAHITALTAGTVRTDTLVAGVAHMLELAAGDITAAGLQVDELAAQLANVAVLCAGTASFDRATVTHLVANALNLSYGVGDEVFISNLKVDYAQMAEAAIGNLCVKASNGNYYTIDVAADGTVTATQATVTQAEINAGQTSSGRVILDTEITASSLTTSTLLGTYALINAIDAARIDVDQLFAREAFVDRLNTGTVLTPGLLTIRSEASAAQASADAAQASADAIQVGGRNLISSGATAKTGASEDGDLYVSFWYLTDYGTDAVKAAEASVTPFTFSFDWSLSAAAQEGTLIYPQLNARVMQGPSAVSRTISGLTSGHYTQQISVTTEQQTYTATDFRVRVRMQHAQDGLALTVKNIKLEAGNRATDWTPAPEDVDSGISVAQAAAATADGKAVAAQADATAAGTAAASAASAAAQAQADATAAGTAAEVADGKAVAAASAASSAQTAASAAQTAASGALQAIEDLEIGGRNLMLGTMTPSATAAKRPRMPNQAANTTGRGTCTTAAHGIRFTSTTANWQYLRWGTSTGSSATLNGLTAGETYTLSCDLSWQLLSGSGTGDDSICAVLYVSTNGTNIPEADSYKIADIPSASRGAEMSARCAYTFTVPADAVGFYLDIKSKDRTAAHYAIGDYIEARNIKLERGAKATDWTPAPEDVQEEIDAANAAAASAAAAIVSINDDIDEIQRQLDGQVESWYYSGAPTLSNAPAVDWNTTALKEQHEGDTYTDLDTEYSYRFVQINGTWQWSQISDSAATQALAEAQAARDLADHKRRVFVTTPTPPYDQGDLWVQGSGGDILRCQTAKASSGSYAAGDWVLASKYTDDSAADAAQATADGAASAASAAQTAATAAGTAAAAAQADIDGLSIGGRQLLTGTATVAAGTASDGGYANSRKYYLTDYGEAIIAAGDRCVVSMAYELSATPFGTGHTSPRIYAQLNNSSISNPGGGTVAVYLEAGVLTGVYTMPFTPTTDQKNYSADMYVRLRLADTADGVTVTVKNIKLEAGNRATDWTPAPEEVDAGIATAQSTASGAATAAASAATAAASAASAASAAQDAADDAQDSADAAQLAAEAAQATADDAAGVTRQLKHWFEFSETDGLVTQAEGSTYSTVVDAEGFHVRQNGEKIGSFAKRRLCAEEVRVGKVATTATRCVLREAGDGGMIITVEGLT